MRTLITTLLATGMFLGLALATGLYINIEYHVPVEYPFVLIIFSSMSGALSYKFLSMPRPEKRATQQHSCC